MASSESLTISDSIGSKLRSRGGAGIFLLIRPRDGAQGSLESVLALVKAAADVANAAVMPEPVTGSYATTTARGVALALLAEPIEKQALRTWLSAFGEHLRDHQFAGRVAHAGLWSPDVDHLIVSDTTYPATFVAYRASRPPSDRLGFPAWQVDPEVTRTVTEALMANAVAGLSDHETWARLAGGSAGSITVPDSEAPTFLQQTLSTVAGSGAHHVLRDRSGYHQAHFERMGQCVTQMVLPDSDWQRLLAKQIDNLLVAPESADVGMVRNIGTLAIDWVEADARPRHRTVLEPVDYQANRHLWDQHVIDAAGVNLLTNKHLEQAHDLTNWTIEEVAPDRFLVKARDPEPWFGRIAPDAATVTKARADFGNMILNWDTIVANPGPTTNLSPGIVGRLANW